MTTDLAPPATSLGLPWIHAPVLVLLALVQIGLPGTGPAGGTVAAPGGTAVPAPVAAAPDPAEEGDSCRRSDAGSPDSGAVPAPVPPVAEAVPGTRCGAGSAPRAASSNHVTAQ